MEDGFLAQIKKERLCNTVRIIGSTKNAGSIIGSTKYYRKYKECWRALKGEEREKGTGHQCFSLEVWSLTGVGIFGVALHGCRQLASALVQIYFKVSLEILRCHDSYSKRKGRKIINAS